MERRRVRGQMRNGRKIPWVVRPTVGIKLLLRQHPTPGWTPLYEHGGLQTNKITPYVPPLAQTSKRTV